MMISRASITLLVTGSIAAYKSAELVRELKKQGASVTVAMTDAAQEFITPLTLQTLSGSPVVADMFDLLSESTIGHISLADAADVILVAPASADCIAKAAHGLADDIVTTVLLAARCPIVFAPAMNVNMWTNSITQQNVQRLQERGCVFIDPEEGELACGWQGSGRLAETSAIIDALELVLTAKDLRGSRVIVTAGPTREMIDPVRFVSNHSSGKMGYAIATVARWMGADVTLISGPSNCMPPRGVQFEQVQTAEEMHDAVFEAALKGDSSTGKKKQYIYMVAAVTDHRPANASVTKLKPDKSQPYSIQMEPCPDILQALGERREEIEAASGHKLTLIGFSAETGDEEELLFWARDKLQRKNADLMVGNFARDALGKDTNRVWLLERGGRQEEVATADKLFVARKIVTASLKL